MIMYDFCNNEKGLAIKTRIKCFRNPRNKVQKLPVLQKVQSKHMWEYMQMDIRGFALEYDLRRCIFNIIHWEWSC